MRQKTRILIIVFLTISTISAPSYALQNDIMPERNIRPMFTYINGFQCYFDISSIGKAEADVFLLAYNVDQVKVEANIQQYSNGAWQTIKSWSKLENGASGGLSSSWYLMGGYTYRLVAKGYVYVNGTMVENDQIISQTISY